MRHLIGYWVGAKIIVINQVTGYCDLMNTHYYYYYIS